MAQSTARAALALSAAEEQSLRALAASRTAAVREVQRAKILLGYHAGENFSTLSRNLHVSRRIVYKHVDRALAACVLQVNRHDSSPIRAIHQAAVLLVRLAVFPAGPASRQRGGYSLSLPDSR